MSNENLFFFPDVSPPAVISSYRKIGGGTCRIALQDGAAPDHVLFSVHLLEYWVLCSYSFWQTGFTYWLDAVQLKNQKQKF